LGRIRGIARPTIGVFLPGERGGFSLVLDGGANVDCKAQYLYEFALMGSIFLEVFYQKSNPSIGLLNVGEESTKGNSLSLETYNILSNSGLNFLGNLEGSDIFKNKTDIVVCDGFVGNIILKFGESIIPTLKSKFYQYAAKSIFHKIWVALVAKTVKNLLKDFDYQKYGGVPLLGINGNVIIGHGKSSPLAIKNMILRAEDVVTNDLVHKTEEKIKELKNKKIIIEEDE
jgi:glycerol-3-phosphate acyltransferase PlsX